MQTPEWLLAVRDLLGYVQAVSSFDIMQGPFDIVVRVTLAEAGSSLKSNTNIAYNVKFAGIASLLSSDDQSQTSSRLGAKHISVLMSTFANLEAGVCKAALTTAQSTWLSKAGIRRGKEEGSCH